MIINHLRANVVSYLALAVALSTGTAYAAGSIADGSVTAGKLAKDSVKSRTIKNNTVKSVDIKDGSLTSADVMDGSLTSADVMDGSLTSADLAARVLPTGLVFSGKLDGGDPSPTPDLPNESTFTFTSSGSTYIQLTYNTVGLSCSSGGSFMGLYLDGSPVPHSRYSIPTQPVAGAASIGAVVTTTPGSHTATVGLDCPIGTFTVATHFGDYWFVLTSKT